MNLALPRLVTLSVRYLIAGLLMLTLGCEQKTTEKERKTGPGFFSAIKADSLVDLTLTFNMKELMDHRQDEHKIGALLTVSGQSVPIRIGSRGVTRKKICAFPPLHIYLSDSLKSRWGPYKKYKLVTHCEDSDSTDQLVQKEYLIYKLYGILTRYALDAQLCRVHYQTEYGEITRLGFIIEDEDEMASRVGGVILKNEVGQIPQIQKQHYQLLALFQYMIGNTDWNLSRRHNIKFIQLDDGSPPTCVPYDFDYSGIVAAPYAVPHPSLPIANVQQRLWQYRGSATDDLSETITHMISLKETFTSSVNSLPNMSEETKSNVRQYIRSFYAEIEQPNGIHTIMTAGR